MALTSAANLPQLVEGLRLLSQSDPAVETFQQQTGEHVILTAGELHLEVRVSFHLSLSVEKTDCIVEVLKGPERAFCQSRHPRVGADRPVQRNGRQSRRDCGTKGTFRSCYKRASGLHPRFQCSRSRQFRYSRHPDSRTTYHIPSRKCRHYT